MQFRTLWLMHKYCPAILNQIIRARINWQKLDEELELQFSHERETVQTNIFNLSVLAESGDQYAISFLNFINDLVEQTEKVIPFKAKFRNLLTGKINNLKDWNYLNPIGEVAVINKFIMGNFKILAIEDKTSYPELSPKDLLIESTDKQKYVVEILNIHLPDKDYENLDKLKAVIKPIIIAKINKETEGILPGNKIPLLFLPVLWDANLKSLKKHQLYFEEFSRSFGKSDGYSFPVLGYCAFGKVSNNFHFGELSSFFNEERYLL